MSRKTPVLLRRAPLSGRINALTNYTRSGDGPIKVRGDGRHDVTASFYALLLEELLEGKGHAEHDMPCLDIVPILDAVADGDPITEAHRLQVRSLRERLRAICEDHNARIESGELGRA